MDTWSRRKVTADATYIAQWQAKKYQYTVNYYYNGKIDPEAGINEEAEYGSEVGYMDKSNGFTFEKLIHLLEKLLFAKMQQRI